jgi:RNA polymerase sigma-70 factor (ECF subfamily)
MHTTFEKDLTKHYKTLYRYALRLTRIHDKAEDLVQDVFLRAIVNQEKFEIGTNMVAWLRTVMFNQFRSNLRKRSNRETTFGPLCDEDGDVIPDFEMSVDATQDSSADVNKIYEITKYLTPMFKDVVREVIFNQKSYEEYARELKVPAGTVKSRLNRGLFELRGLIESRIF